MTEREELRKEIEEITSIIRDDEASVRSLDTTANRDLLVQSIALRKNQLLTLMKRLLALRHS